MSTIRTFVSIPVPVTAEAESLRRDLRIAGIRPSPPDLTHITLKFVGDIDQSKSDRLVRCVEQALSGIAPFELRIRGLGAFPNTGNPSIVWMGADPSDILSDLSERIGASLSTAGFGFDDKPFKAHVTVARCRDSKPSVQLFEKYADTQFSQFVCREVLVMKSVLGPSGAKHSVISRVPLQ